MTVSVSVFVTSNCGTAHFNQWLFQSQWSVLVIVGLHTLINDCFSLSDQLLVIVGLHTLINDCFSLSDQY